jgi:hypothetical protein
MLSEDQKKLPKDNNKKNIKNVEESKLNKHEEQKKEEWVDTEKIFACINRRPHEMTFYIAPFYYKNLIDIIEEETKMKLFDDKENYINGIKLK